MRSQPAKYPRVRVDEETATLLVGLLERERIRVLMSREEMQRANVPDGVHTYNQLMVRIKRLQNELARTMREWGWLPDTLPEE